MKIVRPYQTVKGALRALDNGGRFYNLFTAKGDDLVTSAELKKAAGVVGSEIRAYLFFAMALFDLEPNDRKEVEARLDPGLRSGLGRMGPTVLTPREFTSMRAARTCIVEGYPRQVEDHEESGFIMIPVMTGNITTMMMMPTHDAYQVYEVYETPAKKGASCKVMWPKGQWVTGKNERIRWGGIVKQACLTEKKSSPKRLYLEPQYYTPLG